MKICVPVLDSNGLDSQVSPHFGSAPAFMIVDTDTGECRCLVNTNGHHAHGMCQPLAVLGGEQIDGMVVSGIGMGALMKLQAAGIAVFVSEHRTIGETVAALADGTLRRASTEGACRGHH